MYDFHGNVNLVNVHHEREIFVKINGETTLVQVEGYDYGRNCSAEEIHVTWIEDCHCDRPCCSGSYKTRSVVGLENIVQPETIMAEYEDWAVHRAEMSIYA